MGREFVPYSRDGAFYVCDGFIGIELAIAGLCCFAAVCPSMSYPSLCQITAAAGWPGSLMAPFCTVQAESRPVVIPWPGLGPHRSAPVRAPCLPASGHERGRNDGP